MKVNAINSNFCTVTRSATKNHDRHIANSEKNVNFKGVKGGAKGALIGAAVATTFGVVTGGYGFAVLPLWTTLGAIAGSENENEKKEAKNDKDDKK